jgi:hypothetical protein
MKCCEYGPLALQMLDQPEKLSTYKRFGLFLRSASNEERVFSNIDTRGLRKLRDSRLSLPSSDDHGGGAENARPMVFS